MLRKFRGTAVAQRKSDEKINKKPKDPRLVPRPRDRCYDFLNIFAEKFSEKIGVFYSKQI
jgi:hypothetical protein